MEPIFHNDSKQLDLINSSRTPRAGGETRPVGRDHVVEETRSTPAGRGRTGQDWARLMTTSTSPWTMWTSWTSWSSWTSIHLTRASGVVF